MKTTNSLAYVILLISLTSFLPFNQSGYQQIKLTENEEKGISEILDAYGGQCLFSVGKSLASGNFFELEVSKAEGVQKFLTMPELAASNISYLFYKNLKQERKKYYEIRPVLIFADGNKMTAKYPVSVLEKVDKKMTLAYQTVELIKAKNYDAISNLIKTDTSLVKMDKNKLISNLKEIESKLDPVNTFKPYGFKFEALQNGKEIMHISGAIVRNGKSSLFSINLIANSNEEKILTIDYKL